MPGAVAFTIRGRRLSPWSLGHGMSSPYRAAGRGGLGAGTQRKQQRACQQGGDNLFHFVSSIYNFQVHFCSPVSEIIQYANLFCHEIVGFSRK